MHGKPKGKRIEIKKTRIAPKNGAERKKFMATKTFRRILFRSPVWRQNLESTWEGIDAAYVQSFIDSGCFLCTLTMLIACMEGSTTMKPITLVNRGVTTASNPNILAYNNVSDEFTLDTKDSKFIENITKAIVEDNVPVMIQVQGHAVVAYGYVGNITINTSGEPKYETADSASIRIFDPYKGRYDDNLDGLTAHYGAIKRIRIPVK